MLQHTQMLDSSEKLIAFASRSLIKNERSYSLIDNGDPAIAYAVRKLYVFNVYLTEVSIYTLTTFSWLLSET